MTTYTSVDDTDNLKLGEVELYGSARLGSMQINKNISDLNIGTTKIHTLGEKLYEISNHLGNVLSTVSDKKEVEDESNGLVDQYIADLQSSSDYFPFGSPLPNRGFDGGSYRFGFNGQEKDKEVYGDGNAYTATFWEYDPRIGRRWNLDPVYNSSTSRYACFNNNPIEFIDPNGNYSKIGAWIRSVFNKDASSIYKSGDSWGFNKMTRGNDGVVNGFVSCFGEKYGKANSVWGVLNHSVNEHTDNVQIVGDALEKIKNDPEMIKYQNLIVEEAKQAYNSDPKSFKVAKEGQLITFGGFTNSPLNPTNEDTKKVASNELTWIIRHAYVYANIEVQNNGAMHISYLLIDKLDLTPGSDKTPAYNIVVLGLGFNYHVVLRGTASSISARWIENIE